MAESIAQTSEPSQAVDAAKEKVAGTATNRPFIVGTINNPPFSFIGEGGAWEGVVIELWEAVSEELSIAFQYKEYSLSGLLQAVETGEVDVAAAALTVTAGRIKKMQMTHTFFGSGLGIATAAETDDVWEGFMERFFSWTLLKALLVLFAVLMVAGLLIWLFERKRNPQFSGKALGGLGSGLWWSAVTMTTVGYGDKAPITALGRTVGLIWMFTSIIVISGMTGAIATALTLGQLQAKVDGFKDLRHVRVGVLAASDAQGFLQRQGIHPREYASAHQALEAIQENELDAFVDDHLPLSYWVAKDFAADMVVLPQSFDPGFYALAVPPKSPLREELDVALLEYLQTQAWEAVLRKYRGH